MKSDVCECWLEAEEGKLYDLLGKEEGEEGVPPAPLLRYKLEIYLDHCLIQWTIWKSFG